MSQSERKEFATVVVMSMTAIMCGSLYSQVPSAKAMSLVVKTP